MNCSPASGLRVLPCRNIHIVLYYKMLASFGRAKEVFASGKGAAVVRLLPMARRCGGSPGQLRREATGKSLVTL